MASRFAHPDAFEPDARPGTRGEPSMSAEPASLVVIARYAQGVTVCDVSNLGACRDPTSN